jgi:hypothetical protein
MAAFTIAACSSQPSDGEVRAAESVFAGDIVVSPASSGVSATLSVTGSAFTAAKWGTGPSIVNTFTVSVDDGAEFGPFPAGPGMSIVDVEFTGQALLRCGRDHRRQYGCGGDRGLSVLRCGVPVR